MHPDDPTMFDEDYEPKKKHIVDEDELMEREADEEYESLEARLEPLLENLQ